MADNTNPIDNLVFTVIPKLIERVKQLKEDVAHLQDTLNAQTAEAQAFAQSMGDVLRQHKERMDKFHEEIRIFAQASPADQLSIGQMMEFLNSLNARIDEMASTMAAAAPVPAVKKRSRKKKPEFVEVTGDDILCANYALCSTRGNIPEARILMPEIDAVKFEYIASLDTAGVQEIVAASPVTLDNIPMKYAEACWKEVSK